MAIPHMTIWVRWAKKVPKLYFHFWPPKKCPPFFFLTHTWWYVNITASPCDLSLYRVDDIGSVFSLKVGPFALVIKKYFNEHKTYFNLNCKEVYPFQWEFDERRERLCAFIVELTMISIKKYLLSTCFLLYSWSIVGKNPKAFVIPIFRNVARWTIIYIYDRSQ